MDTPFFYLMLLKLYQYWGVDPVDPSENQPINVCTLFPVLHPNTRDISGKAIMSCFKPIMA